MIELLLGYLEFFSEFLNTFSLNKENGFWLIIFQYSSFKSGVKLATYSWPAEEEKFLVYISHGYHEHAQRYQALAEELNKIGGSVFAHDHFAHGESGFFL